ncbi:MAG: transporter substrate-binding domain-containing protein [Deltaproteobacteria bacterium]|nr:transporter substrate-binding domain-containing protein [Deltaproteobacteria bacterium]
MIKNGVFLLLFLLLCLPVRVSAGDAPLVLNTSAFPPVTSYDKSGFLDLLYQELFARLGIAFEIQILPAERCLQNANAGIDDGDTCRIAGLDNTYTNLVRTTEAVMGYEMVVFSRERDFPVTGPESLAPYALGIVTGWKILERATGEHPARISVDTIDQLFMMLDQGRIEIALIDRLVGLDAVKRLGIKGIRILSPPLLTGDWFLYLHKKHQSLIPRIDGELRKMKQDGSYGRIHRQVLDRYEQAIVR